MDQTTNPNQGLGGRPSFDELIVYREEFPARQAQYAELTSRLHPKLDEVLPKGLFTHQAEAIDLAVAGQDVLVVTGTNSGKSLCFQIPAFQHCLNEPVARCLFLYPTKALAQDQSARLTKMGGELGVRSATYDGDTPKSQRASIRNLCHLVLTNPDMLHHAIMPNHEQWVKFFRSLRMIAIDELHAYRGVFGSHLALILRRILRLCEWHGSRPQIIAASATIGNPTELFLNLTGREPSLVGDDGSPSGKRTFVIMNPPKLENGTRLSSNIATSEALATLVESGAQTLVFNRSRIQAELILRYTRERTPEHAAEIESYRGGYTAKERRTLEKKMMNREILGMSTTNALELGVDIGQLDAVVVNAYPGSSSSFWQQLGRAGRGSRDALAVFVAGDNPLEQFLVDHPERLLNKRSESIKIQPGNPNILRSHLLCAAHERPISPSELENFHPLALARAEELDRAGELTFKAGRFYYPKFESPTRDVNLRGADSGRIKLLLGHEELGEMEASRANTQAHEGAIYLHRGESYVVNALNLEAGYAAVEPFKSPYYTAAQIQSIVEPSQVIAERGPFSISACRITDLVLGYQKIAIDGGRILDSLPLDSPATTFDTIAVRIDLPGLDPEGDMARQMGGIHGVEHALLALAPLFAQCDRTDLGSAWFSVFLETLSPAIFVFDRIPGGIGLAENLFMQAREWIEASIQRLTSCSCQESCPSCLMLPNCESRNESLDKPMTVQLLRWLQNQ